MTSIILIATSACATFIAMILAGFGLEWPVIFALWFLLSSGPAFWIVLGHLGGGGDDHDLFEQDILSEMALLQGDRAEGSH